MCKTGCKANAENLTDGTRRVSKMIADVRKGLREKVIIVLLQLHETKQNAAYKY